MPNHNHKIHFPNGMGFTPCSAEYADIHARMNAIKPDNLNMDDLSPENYEIWNKLDSELMSLQVNGHVGRSVKFAPAKRGCGKSAPHETARLNAAAIDLLAVAKQAFALYSDHGGHSMDSPYHDRWFAARAALIKAGAL